MAFWALDIYFPQWECLNYGAPGEGLAYVESFAFLPDFTILER